MSLLVYYGHDEALLPRLRQCEYLVFEARGWSPVALRRLQASGGPRLLGYLSPFAWPDWAGARRWWWGPSTPDPEWSARWYSLAWPGWRRQVQRLAKVVLDCCDGVFVDNLDRLQADSASLPRLLALLASLRRQRPEIYLLGNRGFSHWDHLSTHLDGVLLENLSDAAFTGEDRRWVEVQLERVAPRDLFALDYADRFEPVVARRLRERYPDMRYYLAPDRALQSLAPTCDDTL